MITLRDHLNNLVLEIKDAYFEHLLQGYPINREDQENCDLQIEEAVEEIIEVIKKQLKNTT